MTQEASPLTLQSVDIRVNFPVPKHSEGWFLLSSICLHIHLSIKAKASHMYSIPLYQLNVLLFPNFSGKGSNLCSREHFCHHSCYHHCFWCQRQCTSVQQQPVLCHHTGKHAGWCTSFLYWGQYNIVCQWQRSGKYDQNMQDGVPVSFTGANTILSVNDKDQVNMTKTCRMVCQFPLLGLTPYRQSTTKIR